MQLRKPNKPMVPTAPNSPAVNPLHLLPRDIGQPLGCDERRATNRQNFASAKGTSDPATKQLAFSLTERGMHGVA
jgi:hypothetical protein